MLLDDQLFVAKTPLIIKWEITKACNLECVHCYASSGTKLKDELSTREVLNLMECMSQLDVLCVQFTGGEPFLRRDFAKILRAADDHMFCIDILTNGTLIDKKSTDLITRIYPHSVQISLDGANPTTHDSFRGLPGSFRSTVAAIERLVEPGVKVSISTTFNRLNVNELDQIWQLVEDLGVKSFLFGFIYPIGRGAAIYNSLALSPREQDRVRDFLIARSKTTEVKIYVDEAIGKIIDGKVKPPVCKAGRIMATVAAEGQVIPCPMLFDLTCGNVRVDDLKEVWEKSKELNYIRELSNLKGRCATCSYVSLCGGGCKAMAYFETGDPMGSDPFCPYAKSDENGSQLTVENLK
mgnify:FL=1